MSWQDRIDNIKFSITTGDGKVFYPFLGNAEKSTEYNTSEFDYIDLEGTDVGRKKPKGGKYPLIFYFQGDDNIEQTQAFEQSAKDNRLWLVVHPFYGEIKGQPLSLGRNDSSLNTTQVTVEFWESIGRKLPKSEVAVREQLTAVTVKQAGLASVSYASVSTLDSSDVRTVKGNVEKVGARYGNSVNNENFSDYQQLKNNAFSAADKLISNPKEAIEQIGSFIQFSVGIEKSVTDRIELLQQMYNDILEIITLGGFSDKVYFESVGSLIIAAVCNTSLSPQANDYITRHEIEQVTNQITQLYNSYLLVIDAAQTNTVTDAYSPDFGTQTNLNALVSDTLVNLFNLAFDAKQERTIQVEKDTNLIILVHKYLGLDSDDENIESFRNINNIRNKNVFKIKKGRTIKYFI